MAHYVIHIRAEGSEAHADGLLRTDMSQFGPFPAGSRATLMLESGRSVTIAVTAVDTLGMFFDVDNADTDLLEPD